MNYDQSLAYLAGFDNLERSPQTGNPRRFKLDRMRRLLKEMGNPHERLRAVHIAGTNGKGSTAVFLASVAEAHGYRVGLYTSPHLRDVRERISMNSQSISKSAFSAYMARIRRALMRIPWTNASGNPTYFEILTAIAFLYFKEARADLSVLETGVGGRLDATNTVRPLVSVITPVGFDHMQWLGHSLSKIAGEKAGIIKKGIPVCTGIQKSAVLEVIRKRCKALGSPLVSLRKAPGSRTVRSMLSTSIALNGSEAIPLQSHMTGSFQAENIALAVSGYNVLHQRYKFRLNPAHVRTGILRARWPGRFECISRIGRTFILDGAHNEPAMQRLVQSTREIIGNRRVRIIFGASSDKDIEALARALASLSSEILLVSSGHSRAASPEFISGIVKPHFKTVWLCPSLKNAIRNAVQKAGKDEVLLITGSLFLVGEARGIVCRM